MNEIALASARHMVTCGAAVLNGARVVGGTHVPVLAVAAMLRDASVADVLCAFPELSVHQVELCALYAEAYGPDAGPVRRAIVVERRRGGPERL